MTAQATVLVHPAAQAALTSMNVVSVASGKGGVGKTWFSISLAYALSRMRRHVLLFDGDIGLANVDVQLGLVPDRDLGDVIAGRCALNNVISRFDDGRFDIVAGKSGSGSLGTLTQARIAGLCHELGQIAVGYDDVIADLSAGVEVGVRTLVANSRTTLTIFNDEPTSLTDAYALIKTVVTRHPDSDIRLVVNSATSHSAGKRTYEALRRVCESFLGYSPQLAGIIRRDAKVADSIRHQMAIGRRHPTSAAAEDVEAIARHIVG